jgi:hypothetical protein
MQPHDLLAPLVQLLQLLKSSVFFVHDARTLVAQEVQTSYGRLNKWGWPRFWRETAQETTSVLLASGMKCFELSSSYGLSGWVVAASARAGAA